MNAQKDSGVPEFKSVEEEREYWEARGPLAKGHRSELNKPDSSIQRSSFLSVRLSGKELTAWRNLAVHCGTGPSTLARNLIIAFLEQADKAAQLKGPDNGQALTLEQACSYLMQNLPSAYSNQMENLLKSTLVGGTNNPQLLFMDSNQLNEFLRLSVTLLAKMFELMNPNVRVVVPPDVLDGSAFRPHQSKDSDEHAMAKP